MAANFSSSSFSQPANESSGNRVVVYVQPASEVSVTPVLASDYLNLHTRTINTSSSIYPSSLSHHSPTRTSPRSQSLISHVVTPPRVPLLKSNYLTPTLQSHSSSDAYIAVAAAARRGLPAKFQSHHLTHSETVLKSSSTSISRTSRNYISGVLSLSLANSNFSAFNYWMHFAIAVSKQLFPQHCRLARTCH